jgi:hypothetical protein
MSTAHELDRKDFFSHPKQGPNAKKRINSVINTLRRCSEEETITDQQIELLDLLERWKFDFEATKV